MNDQVSTAKKNRLTLIILLVVCILPVAVSWYLVLFTDIVTSSEGTLQHGILIDPPRQIENLNLQDPLQHTDLALHGKWTMVTITHEGCNEQCKENLYRMRQIGLTTGKNYHKVQRLIIYTDEYARQSITDQLSEYPGQLLLNASNPGTDLLSQFIVEGKTNDGAMYLIDPRGYLMMFYPFETDPTGIIKDLNRLLRRGG